MHALVADHQAVEMVLQMMHVVMAGLHHDRHCSMMVVLTMMNHHALMMMQSSRRLVIHIQVHLHGWQQRYHVGSDSYLVTPAASVVPMIDPPVTPVTVQSSTSSPVQVISQQPVQH